MKKFKYICPHCTDTVTLEVEYIAESNPYSIGEYGPIGASFVDAPELGTFLPDTCPTCSKPIDASDLQEDLDAAHMDGE